ncbi:hypothetical protein GGS20DRAFT_575689 [Poronia punctata]|nr:hypothetical protein GGS20DRAFT_575689 [Poronia punctata]
MASSLGVWHECWGYVGVLVFLAFLASVAVALRFWSRRITGSGPYSDDWLALFTLLAHHGLVATVLVAFLADGLGFDTLTLQTADQRAEIEMQKLTFVGTVLYGMVLTCIRLAVILFYLRIFPTKTVRRGGYILAFLCVAWFVAIEGLNLARCTPVAFKWNRTIEGGRCISVQGGVIAVDVISLVMNGITVCLPIREVFKMDVSGRRKFAISCIFLIGGVTILASLARLVATLLLFYPRSPNTTGTTSALLWAATGFEIYLAIIAACAPTFSPAYNKLYRRPMPSDSPIPRRSGYTTKPTKKKPSSHFGKGISDLSSRLRESDDEERPFKRFDDIHILVPPKGRGEFWTNITARPASSGVEPGRIRVQRDVTWN